LTTASAMGGRMRKREVMISRSIELDFSTAMRVA
jgi:hypothetical protein